MIHRIAVATLLGLVAPAAGAATPKAATAQPVELHLHAAITVGADGTMQSLEWRDDQRVLKMIAERVEPAVRGWHFAPGQVDGAPAPTQTFLHMVFKGLPAADGSMKLEFVSADTGAAWPQMVVPDYPRSAMYGGYTAVVITIVDFNAQGVPTLRSYDYHGEKPARKAFIKSVEEAVSQSKIDLERVGGHPVATSVRIPFVFRLDSTMPTKDEHGNPIDAAHAVPLESAVRLLDARDPLAAR